MMGIIRNHLLQMKVENPAEYRRLMDGYNNETEFVRDVLGLTLKGINYYLATGGHKNYGNERFNSRSIRSTKQLQKAPGIKRNKGK